MTVPGPTEAPTVAGTTQDERTMAVMAHALQLVGSWIAPLIIFFVKRQSRFVSFHSLQVLFLQLLFIAIDVFLIVVGMSAFALNIITSHASGNNNISPALVAMFALLWLFFMAIWLVKVVIAVVYSVKAGRGEWAEYPVLGRWAREVLKIGPAGAPIG